MTIQVSCVKIILQQVFRFIFFHCQIIDQVDPGEKGQSKPELRELLNSMETYWIKELKPEINEGHTDYQPTRHTVLDNPQEDILNALEL